jgi:hypothetical protein
VRPRSACWAARASRGEGNGYGGVPGHLGDYLWIDVLGEQQIGARVPEVVEVEDSDFGYGLFVDGVRVASFGEWRIGYREWARRNGRLADIYSIDDRLDHDINELMA